jgi:hypothetical protein
VSRERFAGGEAGGADGRQEVVKRDRELIGGALEGPALAVTYPGSGHAEPDDRVMDGGDVGDVFEQIPVARWVAWPTVGLGEPAHDP